MFEHAYMPLIIAATLLTVIVVFFMACTLILLKKRQNLKSRQHLEALLEDREHTMYKLSMEIHDNVNQMLNMASMHMHVIEDGVYPDTRPVVQQVSTILNTLIFDTQNISHTLNPRYLKSRGFINSLQEEAKWLNATNRIRCEVNIEGERKALSEQTGLMVFRIAQEAIQNIIKYAQADRVGIHLKFGDKNFEMRIIDNGKGIDTDAATFKEGVGMDSLRQRASIIKGSLGIYSVPGSGTSVVLTIPDAFVMQPAAAQEG
ncbi:MAG: hypothetical protein J0H46_02380 [Bacteroidetes bacterium]|nr:hypothetical protein [Bacteroidota bacterium]